MGKRKKRSLLTALLGFALLLSLPMAALAGSTDACTGECTHEAAIGSMHYDTLGEAFDAVASGETITLLKDISIDTQTYTVADGKAITLDMSGKKLTVTDDKATDNYELFYILGEMKVKGNGTIELTATTNREWNALSAIFHNRGGVLTIENGTYRHLGGTDMAWVVDNSGNYYGDATTNIKGGTLSSTYTAIRNRMEQNSHGASGKAILNISGGEITGTTSAIWAQAASTSTTSPATGEINISDGTVGTINTARSEGAECMTTISGGTVAAFKGEIGELTVKGSGQISGDILLLSASNEAVEEIVVDENGTYIQQTTSSPAPVAEVGGVKYTTLQKAIEAAKNGGTVTVLRDITLSASIEITEGMDVTIEGSGKTITGAEGADVFYVKGGKLTLGEGLNLHAPTDCCVYIRGGEVVTAANMTKAGTNYSVIQGNGNYSGNVTITGGTITNQIVDGCAIYWPQDGKLTIEDGTITGGTAVRLNSGSLEISGGKLIANGTKKAYVTADGSSSFDDTGDALMIDNVGGATGYEEISQVAITGGTFTSKNAAAVGSYTAGNAGVEAKTGFITGGTYSDNSALAYLATGYTLESYTDSTGKTVYGVEPTYTVSFTLPEGAMVTVKNAAGQTIAANAAGKYELTDGTYTFTVSKENYVDKSASFTVNGANQEIVITLDALEIVTHTVTYKADGEVVDQMQVAHGGDATAPAVPAKAGYIGAWNHDGKGIVADTEIVAVYTKNATGGEGGTPVTGEESNSGLWLGILLASAAALAVLAVVKAKQRKAER